LLVHDVAVYIFEAKRQGVRQIKVSRRSNTPGVVETVQPVNINALMVGTGTEVSVNLNVRLT
jgi:hypothetical protein